MSKKYVIGLMSGTSLDGIDAALVSIDEDGQGRNIELLSFIEEPLDENLKEKIKKSCSPESSDVETICSLNFQLGYAFANAAHTVCEKVGFPISKVDYIGSHGQTIYHIPSERDKLIRSTLQIGEPAIIAYETKTPVISDFRVMDMAAGGQGAPLVPYTEYLLYKSDKNRCLQNIGGIGNVTVIPANGSLDDVFAFDTGPGNMIINEVVEELKSIPYDKDGYFASKGQINEKLLNKLMDIEYIKEPPPKTTGREKFGRPFALNILEENKHLKDEDIIATVTMYTAKSIAYNYKRFVEPSHNIDEVIVGGGGSYNKTLVGMLGKELPQSKVMIQEDLGLMSSAKEAIAFALLAYETMNKREGNVLGATGAKERVLLGNITPFNK